MSPRLTQYRFGAILALVHLALFVAFLLHMNVVRETDGQAILLWLYWFPIDYPVSLLLVVTEWLATGADAVGEVIADYSFYVVHGILGTLWWLYVPSLAGNVIAKLRSN